MTLPRRSQHRLTMEVLEPRQMMHADAQLVANPNGGLNDLYDFTSFKGSLYYTANDGIHGNELWKTDGTAAGTVLVKDIAPGGDALPSGLTNHKGTLFFAASGPEGRELWKTDGTTNGTVLVKDIGPTTQFGNLGSYPQNFASVGNQLFFGVHSDDKTSLWKTDGTAAGTVQVKDFSSIISPYTPIPFHLTNVSGKLFFLLNGTGGVRELWTSDGTTAGTKQIKVVQTGPDTVQLSSHMNVNGTFFFANDDGVNGGQLWKSDGTAAGTHVVKHIDEPFGDPHPNNFAEFNGKLYFTAWDNASDRQVWQTDGTEAGTFPFADRRPELIDVASSLVNVHGTLYYRTGGQLDIGSQIWKSDGTSAGAQFVANGGPSGGEENGIVRVGSRLYYIAPYLGKQAIFRLEGSQTTVAYVPPGTSSVSRLTAVNDKLYFSVDRFDEFENFLHALWVLPASQGPKVTLSGGTTYRENDPPIILAPNATVTDRDSANFAGGRLTVTITAGARADNRLSIRNQGTAAGQIGLSGTNVKFGNVVIGTYSGGSGTNPLKINLNASATAAATQALVRNIRFSVAGDNPTATLRTVRFTLTDGDGGTSAPATRNVSVVAVNDKPALTLSGSLGYVRNAPPVVLAPNALVNDPDSANFSGGQLRVWITTNGGPANTLAIGSGFTVDANNKVKLGTVVIGTRVSSGVGTHELRITFNENATRDRVQQLVRSITYRNVGGAAGQRKIAFTVSDGDGGLSDQRFRTVNVS